MFFYIMEDWLYYEHMVIDFHQCHNPGSLVWHWSQIPEDELHASGWIHPFNEERLKRRKLQEYGLDGLAKNPDGSYTGIQAKCWNSRKLKASDLGTFMVAVGCRLQQKDNRSMGYLYYTSELEDNVRDDFLNSSRFHAVKLPLSRPHRPIIPVRTATYPAPKASLKAVPPRSMVTTLYFRAV